MTEDERTRLIDEEHLRLLRLGFFIAAAANAIWILLGAFYCVMGLFIALAPMQGSRGEPPEFLRWIFVGAGVVVGGVALILSALKLLVALRIGERRSRIFCMVVSAITCLAIPYGTTLGVLALLVLSRPSVALQFHEA